MTDGDSQGNGAQRSAGAVELRVAARLENLAVLRTLIGAVGTFEDLDFDAVAALGRLVEERLVGVGRDGRMPGRLEELLAVEARREGVDDLARDDVAVGALALAGFHLVADERLDLDDLVLLGRSRDADAGSGLVAHGKFLALFLCPLSRRSRRWSPSPASRR